MTQKRKNIIHLVYSIVLSVLVVALGICFAFSCVTIYKSGDRPFTTESISEQLVNIFPLAVTTFAFVIGGIVLSAALPLEEKRPLKAEMDLRSRAKRMRELLASYGEKSKSASKMRALRTTFAIITGVICAILSVPVLVYFSVGSNFTLNDLNGSVISATYFTLPFALVALALHIVYSYVEKISYKKEIECLKSAIASAKSENKTKKQEESPVKNGKSKFVFLLLLRIVLFVIAAAFILIGIFNGGMSDVLNKAIAICTECIGLG